MKKIYLYILLTLHAILAFFGLEIFTQMIAEIKKDQDLKKNAK